jgi:hypothetical protein
LLFLLLMPALSVAAQTGQDTLSPQATSTLQDAKRDNRKIIVTKVGGVAIKGVPYNINPDSVDIFTKYGVPLIHVPYSQVAAVSVPPLSHRSKVGRNIAIVAGAAGIGLLAYLFVKHKP